MAAKRAKRKTAAILFADGAGYGRLMAENAEATVRTLRAYQETISIIVKQHRGHIVDRPADKILSEFTNAVDAVECAVEIQQVIGIKNTDLPEQRRMEFRIGINLADLIEEGERIHGVGINVAALIGALADPGGICITGAAHEQIESEVSLGYVDLGEHILKNIPTPVRAYVVLPESRPRQQIS